MSISTRLTGDGKLILTRRFLIPGSEKRVSVPAFSGQSYLAYQTPPHILRRLKISFKLKANDLDDCLLLYASQSEGGYGDFTSLSLEDRRLVFRFDTGSGPAVIRSQQEVERSVFHWVVVSRRLRQGRLVVEGVEVRGEAPGHTRGLNIKTPLYLGGLNTSLYQPAAGAGEVGRFRGCITDLQIGGRRVEMISEAVDSANIEECQSSLCDTKPCHNEGLCLDHDNGTFSCDCQGVFGGLRCEEEGSLCDQSPPPCENGGTCSGNSSHYHCYCPWGHTGKHCDTGTS